MVAVDLFCGAGGASTGLVRACDELGIDLDLLAVNHWPTAVQTHLLNHPGVRHMCEAVERIDPRAEIPGGRVNLLLAGPECTHFSTARGGRPVNPQSRASAWNIVKWAQELYIDTILIENVPEFRTWGPIGADFKPLKSKKGETYRAFLAALRSLDYKVEDRILNAANYGDPTTRQRLFIIAKRSKRHGITWPVATHSKSGVATLFGKTKKWKAAREIIDWSIEGKSIFNRKKPLRPATIARILAGLEKFGGPSLQPFLVILRNNGAGASIDSPIPTLTAGGQHVGVAEPFIVPVNHGAGELRSRSIEEPLPTLTARANQYLVEPMVLGQQSGSVARRTSEPLPTIATGGAIALAEPFLVPMYGEREGQSPRTHSVDQPVPVIPATGSGKFGVVEPCLVQTNERRGARVSSVDDPVKTITAVGGRCIGLAEPFMVAMEHGGRVLDIDNPVPTITTAKGGAFGVAEPFIVDAAFGDGDPAKGTARRGAGHASLDAPLGTIPGSNRFALAEPFVVSAGGANLRQPRTTEEPLPTVMGSDRLAVVEPFLSSYYGTVNVSPVSEPVPTVTTKDRFGLVMPVINGLALDIRFRMLQPHELAAAMSFPKSYVFHGKREEVVKQIGNSWPGELSYRLNLELAKDYAPKASRDAKASIPAEAFARRLA